MSLRDAVTIQPLLGSAGGMKQASDKGQLEMSLLSGPGPLVDHECPAGEDTTNMALIGFQSSSTLGWRFI